MMPSFRTKSSSFAQEYMLAFFCQCVLQLTMGRILIYFLLHYCIVSNDASLQCIIHSDELWSMLWLSALVLFRLLHITQKVRVTQVLCQSSPRPQTDPAAPANPPLRANSIPPTSAWPGVSLALRRRLWTCIRYSVFTLAVCPLS